MDIINKFNNANGFVGMEPKNQYEIEKISSLLENNDIYDCDSGVINLYIGRYFWSRKEYADAEKYYLKCVHLNYVPVFNDLVDFYIETGDKVNIYKYVNLGMMHGDVNVYYSYAIYLLDNRPDANKLKILSKYLIKHKHVHAYYIKGNYYLDCLREKTKASDAFMKGIKLSKSNYCMFAYAKLNKSMEHYIMAAEHNDVDAICKLGKINKKNGNYTLMKKYFEMAVSKFEHVPSMEMLANFYNLIEPNKYLEMLYLEKAAKKYHGKSLKRLADIHQKINPEITEYYYQLAAKHSISPTKSFWLGKFYFDNDRYIEMIPHLEYAASCGQIDSINLLGLYYYKKTNNIQLAIEYFKCAVQKGCPQAFINLGKCYAKQNSYQEMLDVYKNALKNGNMNFFFHLGKYYYRKGDTREALFNWQTGITHNCVKSVIAYSQLMLNRLSNEKAEIIIPMCDNIVSCCNDGKIRIKAIKILVELYRIQNQKNKMLKYLEIGLNEKDDDCVYQMAYYYYSLPDYTKSIEYYKLIVDTRKYRYLVRTELFTACFKKDDYKNIIEHQLLDDEKNINLLNLWTKNAQKIIDIYKLGIGYNNNLIAAKKETVNKTYIPGSKEYLLAKKEYENCIKN